VRRFLALVWSWRLAEAWRSRGDFWRRLCVAVAGSLE